MTLRTVLADRDGDFRHLVALALGRDAGFEVCGATGDGRAAVELVDRSGADLLLLDVDLCHLDGIEVVARAHARLPGCTCILLSSLPPAELAAVHGAVGVIHRSTLPRRLPGEVRALAAAVGVAEASAASTRNVGADRTAPRSARRFVNEVLSDSGYGDVLDVVELLVTEVVTNAVIHARSDADVVVRLLPDAVRVEVLDADDSFPVRRRPHPDQPGGRGFDLVEQLSRSWGIDMLDVGKRTWFEVARTGVGVGG